MPWLRATTPAAAEFAAVTMTATGRWFVLVASAIAIQIPCPMIPPPAMPTEAGTLVPVTAAMAALLVTATTTIVQRDRAVAAVVPVARVALVRAAKPTTTVPETWDVAVASVTGVELPVQMGTLLQPTVLAVHAMVEAGMAVPIRAVAQVATAVLLVPQTPVAQGVSGVTVVAFAPRVPQVRAVNPAPIAPGF
jgi:hypothetical protein